MSGQPGMPNPGYVQQRAMLKTDRSLIIIILLSIVTFGIYGIIFMYKSAEEINIIASKWDGKNTLNYLLVILLSGVTFGIYALIWYHMFFDRLGGECARRQIDYKIGAGTFWGWCVFGILLMGIGPLIGAYKFCQAMNLLSEHYNQHG